MKSTNHKNQSFVLSGIQINKQFDKKLIFQNLNFNIPQNAIIQLMGENGSGKSTLYKMIAGLENVSTGKIQYKNIHSFYEQLLFLSPSSMLYESFSPYENLKFFYSLYHSNQLPFPKEKLQKILEIFSLTMKIPCRFLSSGEKQKTRLALLFFIQPKYILLDEPFSHLDETSKITAIQILKKEIIPSSEIFLITNHGEKISFVEKYWIIKQYQIEEI